MGAYNCSTVTSAEIGSLANCLRSKLDETSLYEWPDDFMTAVNNVTGSIFTPNFNSLVAGTCTAITESQFTKLGCSGSFFNLFKQNQGISLVSVPAVSRIFEACFQNIDKLRYVDTPSCLSYGAYAFQSCSRLSRFSAPELIRIGYNCFTNCTALEEFQCDNLSQIGINAFEGCTTLMVAVIQNCKYIGNSAFTGCENLQQVFLTMTSNCVLANSEAFLGCPTNMKIYVSPDYLSHYRSATNWSYYASQIITF